MKKKKKVALVLVLAIIIAGGLYVYLRYNKALVTVENNSEEQITNVEVLLEYVDIGQGTPIGKMTSRAKETIRVYPNGENAVKISYKDSHGKQHISKEAYIEGKGGYHISFIIKKSDIIIDATTFP